jgi:hypothetical protein
MPEFVWRDSEKTRKILGQNSRYAGRDLKPRPPKHEAGLLDNNINH